MAYVAKLGGMMLFFIIVDDLDLDLDDDDDDGSLLLLLNLVHSPFPRLKSSRDARDELSAADADTDADAIVGINKAADAAMRASRRLRNGNVDDDGNDDDDDDDVDTFGCLSSAFISSLLLLLLSS